MNQSIPEYRASLQETHNLLF